MGIQENSRCEFVIIDSFGDGICCDAGPGFYRLYYGTNTTAPGALLAEGGEFELEERVDFVVALRPTSTPTMSPAPTQPLTSISIFIRFDEEPMYTGWALRCDDTFLAHFPRESYSEDFSLQSVTKTFLVVEGAVCDFFMVDYDGICCDYGEGIYQIYSGDNVQGGVLFAEGGEFESVEIVSFRVEQGQLVEV